MQNLGDRSIRTSSERGSFAITAYAHGMDENSSGPEIIPSRTDRRSGRENIDVAFVVICFLSQPTMLKGQN